MVRDSLEFSPLPPRVRARGIARAIVTVTFLLCASAIAQNATDDPQRCEDFEVYRHVRTTEPLPSGPLLRAGISDEEVREVQRAALDVYPDFIVSISGVVDGCNCEEGGGCTAQLWLLLNRSNQIRTLVLSRIDGHWKIGAMQSWLIQYNKQMARFPLFGPGETHLAWQRENQRLRSLFPACPIAPAEWMALRTEGYGPTCVDTSSFKISGDIRRVIFKHPDRPPKRISSNRWVRYSIGMEAFDCKDQRMRTDASTMYFNDGTAEPGFADDPVIWYPIRPDTVPASDLAFVCGWQGKMN